MPRGTAPSARGHSRRRRRAARRTRERSGAAPRLGARERARGAARLVLPARRVAAMHAHIMTSADLSVVAAHDDHRRLADGDVLAKIVALMGDVPDASRLEPDARKDALSLQLEILGGYARLRRHRFSPEVGIVLDPVLVVARLGRHVLAPSGAFVRRSG